MNERNSDGTRDSELRAPRRLRDDLTALYGGGAPPTDEVDGAIVAMARRRLERRRRVPGLLRWVGPMAAAAAAALVAVWLFHPAQEVTALRQDIDRSGRVDILDALSLARHVESGRDVRPEWDMNSDGLVNREDVDLIAMSAVSLSRRPIR